MSRHPIKLKYQILIYVIACISVFFLLQMFTIYFHFKAGQEEQTQTITNQLIRSKSNDIGAWLNQRLEDLRIAARNESVRSMDIPTALTYLEDINTYLDPNHDSSTHLLTLADEQGTVYLEGGGTLDVSQREFFQRAFASEKEYTVSKPLISRLIWERVVMITYPVTDEEDCRSGYLLGTLLLSQLGDILSDIDVYGGTVWIMDQDGRILAEDNNHDHKEDNSACPKTHNLTKTAEFIQKLDVGSVRMNVSGMGDTLIFASVPYVNDWILCVAADSAVINESTDKIRNSSWNIWVGLLTAAILLTPLFLRPIVKPLDRLAAAMDNMDPDSPPVLDENGGTEELQRLARSYNEMGTRIHLLLSQVVEEQEAKRNAERRLLQAQIKPHFLYNTLDTISWKAMDYGATEVSDLINALSAFFRGTLAGGRDFITLDEEAEHIYSYLFIQQVRYADRMDFSLELDDSLRDCRIIKLLIQPLVENALYHGIKPKEGSGTIWVTITPVNSGAIMVSVRDDGVGIPPDKLEALRRSIEREENDFGFGLCSIPKLLRLTYGPKYKLSIDSEEGRGTQVTFTIPLERYEHDENDLGRR